MERPKKVLLVGSGAIKIAEAAEFDYSGSQALKALREEGIETVLVNPNVATVQTGYEMADKIYMLPVSADSVEKVVERERPDAIMIGFGGQSALNAGVDLSSNGSLERYGVRLLGTPIRGIEKALSREKFKEEMERIGIDTPPSMVANSKEEAISHAAELDYPIILRVSFNLGGRGSIIANSPEELEAGLDKAFAQSRTGEILMEKHLKGWKEIEYEVVRDSYGNCVVTACIENLDPMGVHTGESVAVTPAQTLDNHEYQLMRSTAIRVAEAIELVGECNVQFALDPKSYKFYVIETNPRMSRSSALASKATGYPLAYVSAKLALGYKIYDVKNTVSKATTACFEPSLDYITIKMPRWDLDKFEGVNESLGTEMKSIGEVMGIGRSFEEAMQKAARMLEIGEPGIVGGYIYNSEMSLEAAEEALKKRRPYWFLYAAKAFKEGGTVEHLNKITGVAPFFLEKIKDLVSFYERIDKNGMGREDEETARKLGFSGKQLGRKVQAPFVKQMDTLAGEWPAKANYLYMTQNASEDDLTGEEAKNGLLVLGAGCFRIGTSVEFDWSAISLVRSAGKTYDVTLANCNPETVSTDWDVVDRLYFEELNSESIINICMKSGIRKVALFAAGQTGNNIAMELESSGVEIFGSGARKIESAENRESFSRLCERLEIKQPEWANAGSAIEAKRFADSYGFPILVRPSFVLSGSAMKIAWNIDELTNYIEKAARISGKHPVVVSRYIDDAIEADLDCAADSNSIIGVAMEHVEEAGVHSGDATLLYPAENLPKEKLKEAALRLVGEMGIRGPFNIQFVIDRNEPLVIELNMRASRSMPFASKSTGINLIKYAFDGIEGRYGWSGFNEPKGRAHSVKSAQFSWSQLRGAYPSLGPEMRSTGEVASFGKNANDALLKSWLSVAPNRLPRSKILIYGSSDTAALKRAAEKLRGFDLCTLEGASVDNLHSISLDEAVHMLKGGKIDLVVTNGNMMEKDYAIRRTAADINLPMILNGRLADRVLGAFSEKKLTYLELSEYLAGYE